MAGKCLIMLKREWLMLVVSLGLSPRQWLELLLVLSFYSSNGEHTAQRDRVSRFELKQLKPTCAVLFPLYCVCLLIFSLFCNKHPVDSHTHCYQLYVSELSLCARLTYTQVKTNLFFSCLEMNCGQHTHNSHKCT